MSNYKIFTDGAALINPGPSGWSVIIAKEEDVCITDETIFFSGGEPHATNNRAELTAIYEALKWIKSKEHTGVTIWTDSKYCQKALSSWCRIWAKNGWKNRKGDGIANIELMKPMFSLFVLTQTKIEWVKGHNGNIFNEFADNLATKMALQFANERHATFDSVELGDRVAILVDGNRFTTTFEVKGKFAASSTIYLHPVSGKHLTSLIVSASDFDNAKYIRI